MTREEFTQKFSVGDKITNKEWIADSTFIDYVEIIEINNRTFNGKKSDGLRQLYNFDDYDWFLESDITEVEDTSGLTPRGRFSLKFKVGDRFIYKEYMYEIILIGEDYFTYKNNEMEAAKWSYNAINSPYKLEPFVEGPGRLEHSPSKMPPLGLVPKYIRTEERLHEVREAISRYYHAEMEIPVEWIEEHNEIIKLKNK